MRRHHFSLERVELSERVLKQYDCVALITGHKKFDYELIESHAQLIVDTRGVFLKQNQKTIRS